MYDWDFHILFQYRWLFFIGTMATLLFAVLTSVLGLIAGMIAALMMLSRSVLVRLPVVVYVGLFRCTPVLVQLVWFYYALPGLTGITMTPVTAGVLALSLYGGAFYGEIIRGGIVSIEAGQWDGARALGMRRAEVMRRVVLPQAFTRMIPPLVNQSILQLKNTSLMSAVAVPDLLYQSQIITAETYRPLEVYTTVAVIYLVILFPLTLLVNWLEIRLNRKVAQ
jgi:polar amino acid transport system permease protein